MRLALTAAAMAAFSTQASAAEWWLVATTRDHQAVFVDRRSIADASTSTRRVTAASTQIIDAAASGARTARRFTAYFECNGRYSGSGSLIFNDPDGASPSGATNAQMEARLAPAAPGSGDPETILFGCNEKKIIEGEAQFSISGIDFFEVKEPSSSVGAYLSGPRKQDGQSR